MAERRNVDKCVNAREFYLNVGFLMTNAKKKSKDNE